MTYYQSYGYSRPFHKTVDWWLIICWFVLVIFGWLNIYASVHGQEPASIFDLAFRSGKQFVWILSSVGLASLLLFVIPPRVYEPLAPVFYGLVCLLLVAVIFIGGEVKGSHSWFILGPVSFQPAEISKITTSLMLAAVMSRSNFKMKGKDFWKAAAIVLIPMLVIICEKETGSALVYIGFIFVLYREGLSGWLIAMLAMVILLFILSLVVSPFVGLVVLIAAISFMDSALSERIRWWLAIAIPLIVGTCFVPEAYKITVICSEIAVYVCYSAWRALRGIRQQFRLATLAAIIGGVILTFSTDFIFDKVLQPHQKARVEILLGMKEDNSGAGYNVNQSKIAIGSGGMWGKGFCQGTQTAYGFVPEQSTDFIFCTVGEEWGFAGCLCLICIYILLISRIIHDSERSRETFTRIYGYCLAACLFMHMFINMGMTLGLMPVIGIPLPFMSYGGSSMWGFTTMLFIFVALDRNERKYF